MISFDRLRVSARLAVAGVAIVVGLAVIASYTLVQIKSDALIAHSERIKHLVEVSKGIIGNYQKLEADKKLTREEAQQQAKEALRSLRFNTDDYYFIYDFEGRAVMVAGKPSIEGQVLLGKPDASGSNCGMPLLNEAKLAADILIMCLPGQGKPNPSPNVAMWSGFPSGSGSSGPAYMSTMSIER